MESDIFGEFFSKLGDISEDGGPVLDGSDVVLDIFAVFEGPGDLKRDKGELKSSLNIFVPSADLDVGDPGLNL
jgi:hypothetical protein